MRVRNAPSDTDKLVRRQTSTKIGSDTERPIDRNDTNRFKANEGVIWVLHIAKVGSIPSPYLGIVEEQKS